MYYFYNAVLHCGELPSFHGSTVIQNTFTCHYESKLRHFRKDMNNFRDIHVHKKMLVQYILEKVTTPMSMGRRYHDSFLLISAAILMLKKLVNLTNLLTQDMTNRNIYVYFFS